MLRRPLPTGQVLLIHERMPEGHWHLELEGVDDAWVVGWPLNGTIADLLGYQVAHEEWPDWIDRMAEEIAASWAARNPRG